MPAFELPRPGPSPDLVEVTMVSGETLKVLGPSEARWFERARDTYLDQTKFTEVTDRNDLDRLLFMELMVFRWTQHLASGQDYEGLDVDETALKRNLRDYNEQTIKIKEQMGLSRKTRDAAAADGDFSTWFTELKRRAKEFGIHRENQLTTALVLMNELSAHVGAFDRSDTEEREKLGFPDEHSLLEWIRESMLPRYKAVDAHFRSAKQRYWTKD
jgi:hypothetical protein